MRSIHRARGIVKRKRGKERITRAYIHSLRGSLKGKGILKAMMKDRNGDAEELEAKCTVAERNCIPNRSWRESFS